MHVPDGTARQYSTVPFLLSLALDLITNIRAHSALWKAVGRTGCREPQVATALSSHPSGFQAMLATPPINPALLRDVGFM